MIPETAITVKRQVFASDGAGGTTVSRIDSIYEGVPASFRLYGHMSLKRNEAKSGVVVQDMRLVVIYAQPFPVVNQNDLILDEETQQSWIALYDGREYSNTYQIDVRRMS